jgi:ribosomal protein L11 methyltransferase
VTEQWVQIDFDISYGDEELATERLCAAGLPGWESVDRDGSLRLRVWVLAEDAPRVETALEGLEHQASVTPSRGEWAYTASPIRVGRFLVSHLGGPKPSSKTDEAPIVLAPALAFGGGEHATTRASLRALEANVRPGDRVLDVGCGSGVLSVAAALLGAGSVDAVDVDPTSLRATRRAARASDVDVRVLEAGVEEATGPYDLVVANILAPVLVELSSAIMACLDDGGRVLLSGIRKGREREVASAYPALSVVSEHEEEGWMTILMSSGLKSTRPVGA